MRDLAWEVVEGVLGMAVTVLAVSVWHLYGMDLRNGKD